MSATGWRRVCLLSFIVLTLALLAAALIREAGGRHGPAVLVDDGTDRMRTVSLEQMKALPILSRPGSYENQLGNWRDAGVYTGVRLMDLLREGVDYVSLLITAEDGYALELPRERVEDREYPIVLAYAFNGIEVPAWQDGFRLAVLPEDGSVSNAEYRAPSAGAFWVKNVVRITIMPRQAP